MAGAPEPGGHPGEERARRGRPLGGGGLAAVLLSSGRDVAPDSTPAQGAKIGGRAVACIGRCFVRIALDECRRKKASLQQSLKENPAELRGVACPILRITVSLRRLPCELLPNLGPGWWPLSRQFRSARAVCR